MSIKITDTIKKDLSQQLGTYKELPFRLTLGAIAEFYNVSLTPVRLVIDELIDENILLRKPNGRLKRLVMPTGSSKKQPSSRSFSKPLKITAELDERVAIDMMKLSLQNHTEYLREEATAEKYNIGRTIMRQVFTRLAGAGIVEHVPRCGWKVRSYREKDMFDYLEIREILEVKALQLARSKLSEEDLQNILDGNISGNNESDSAINNDLHDYWISRCDNVYIKEFFERNGAFYTALFDFASLDSTTMSNMAQEHRDILESLIAKDWKAAEAALVKHIRDQRENVLRLVRLKQNV